MRNKVMPSYYVIFPPIFILKLNKQMFPENHMFYKCFKNTIHFEPEIHISVTNICDVLSFI